MNDYTADEWNYLVQPWDWAWPENWRARRDDRAAWLPELGEVCEAVGLPFDETFTPAFGSHAVFLFDEFVVKLYARYSPIWFPREVEALEVLGAIPELRTPRLIAADDRGRGRDGHAYIVMERLAGEPWNTLRENGTDEERLSAVRQMAAAVRGLHRVDVSTLRNFGSGSDEWVARIRARAGLAPAYLADELPETLAAQVEPFLAEHLEAITPDFEPRLLSTDVNSFNTLFVREPAGVRLGGQIDFGDMEVGPIDYEWPSVVQKGMRHRPELVRAFFESYGMQLPLAPEQLRRLKVYSLLHRFPTLPYFAETHPGVGSLDELLELQWRECMS